MILNFLDDSATNFDADLCIIGGGIATYTMLSTLSSSSLRILVIERGGMNESPDQESEKASYITGHPFSGHLEGRYFGLGGTSEYWGGQALPLEDDVFTQKDWVDYSGWPISAEDIKLYYSKAERLLKVDQVSYDADVFKLRSLPPLHWDQSAIKLHFSKWSPRPNLKPNLIELCSQHTTTHILLHAVTTSIEYDLEAQQVKNIKIQNHLGKKGTVRASHYVLAAGGIENARLILVSESIPVNKWVGRMFQDHPTAQVATIHPTNRQTLQSYFGYFFKGRTRCLPRLSLTSESQARKNILSATAFIQFLPKQGSLFEASKGVYRSLSRLKMPTRKDFQKLIVSLRDAGDIIPALNAYWLGRFIYIKNSNARLTIMLEQSPSEKSFIGLSAVTDRYGMPLAEIHWHISDDTIKTLLEFCPMLESQFKNLNMGTIIWDSWLHEDDETIKQHLADAFHHMGTTRMSKTQAAGVVDENCCLHGVNNLFVAGSSVFPTSGHSNPTLTFMALAMRLSEHIKSKFQV